MKADAWFPFYPADYLRKTMRLTRDQHGGYMLLLIACWDGGGKLPNDPADLAAITLATPAEWRKLAPKLLPYFEVEGEWLVHPRVRREHEKAAKLSEARREAGAKGGRPQKETGSNEEPIGLAEPKQNEAQTQTPTLVARPSPLPLPSEVEELEASLPAATAVATDGPVKLKAPRHPDAKPIWLADPTFTNAWNACADTMRKRSESREKTWPVWRAAAAKAGGADALLAALLAYLRSDEDLKRTGGPGFHLWLKEGRWEHWLGGDGGSSAFDLASFDAERARLTRELEQQEAEA